MEIQVVFLTLVNLCIIFVQAANIGIVTNGGPISSLFLKPNSNSALGTLLGSLGGKNVPIENLFTTPTTTTTVEITTSAPITNKLEVTTEKISTTDTTTKDDCFSTKCNTVVQRETFKSEVCGTDGKTYQNKMILRCYRNMCNNRVDFLKWGPCFEPERKPTTDPSLPEYTEEPTDGSSGSTGTINLQCYKECPRTNSYSPVCGSDKLMYDNESHLVCANLCGKKVMLQRRGRC